MASRESFLLFLALLCTLSHLDSTLAALYKVGNINGKWAVENYFQVGDFLSFSEHTESTSVHQVSREDYQACEAVSPIKTYRDDKNVADLKEESIYYFISGIKNQCKEGRKLAVVVLATASPSASPISTPPSKTPSATPSVSPFAAPPPKTPSAPSPAVAHAPTTTPPPAKAPAHEPTTSPSPLSLPSSPASTPTTIPASPTSPLSSTPVSSPKASLAATPPGPSGPAAAPSTQSAASFIDLRGAWIIAAASLCSGLMLLL